MARCIVTGSGGFVGSHLTDYLIEKGHTVVGIDNFLTGDSSNINSKSFCYEADIRNLATMYAIFRHEKPDWVFHEAANPRTYLSIEEPLMNHDINITGTLNVLLASKEVGVKKVMFASSCILYSPNTPYYVSKLAGEEYMKIFNNLYGLPTISLRYSNVYGSIRQSEKGSSINAIANLRKTKRDTGRIWISGDGEQTRDWTHVTDIARVNLLAAQSSATGVYDICTGVNIPMNKIASYFTCPVDYVPDMPGDCKHLSKSQDPTRATKDLGYTYSISLNDESMKPYLS